MKINDLVTLEHITRTGKQKLKLYGNTYKVLKIANVQFEGGKHALLESLQTSNQR